MRAVFLCTASAALVACLASSCAPAVVRTAGAADDPRALLDEVGAGRRRLASLTPDGDGFVYALHRSDPSGEDPAVDAEGLVRAARRVCDLGDPVLARLEERLAMHRAPDFDFPRLRCEALTCSLPGPMEFATTVRFVFERDRSGHVGLASVFEVEEVSLPADRVASAWTWVEVASVEVVSTCADIARW